MIWPACDWVLCLCLTSCKSWQARCFQETRRQFVSFPVLIIKGGKRNLDQIILLSHYLSSHQPIVHQITQGCHFIEASSAIIANSLLGRKSLSRLLEGSGAALLESQGVLRSCFFPFSYRHDFPQRFINLTVRAKLISFKENFSSGSQPHPTKCMMKMCFIKWKSNKVN